MDATTSSPVYFPESATTASRGDPRTALNFAARKPHRFPEHATCLPAGKLHLIPGLLFFWLAVCSDCPAVAQESVPAPTPEIAQSCGPGGDCNRCHFCENPTTADRCLRDPCTRYLRRPLPVDAAPDVVLLDDLVREYMPVRFDHQGHARMAEMAGGCGNCHHHTPAGNRPPACSACHDPAVEGTDPRMPGLKGAYHQQCLNCHRNWIDETACEICHVPLPDGKRHAVSSGFPTTDQKLKQVHPPIALPEGDFFAGAGGSESCVIFRHAEHVEQFGLDCVECHHEPSCARCHHGLNGGPPTTTLVEHHRPCVRCHRQDMNLAGRKADQCEKCHWRQETPMPGSFDHASVGWPLKRYHQNVPCRQCHTTVPFARIESRCTACHANWSPSTFDHRVTGQELDEQHAGFECESCHRDGRFDAVPTCDECHGDEDAPIAFPTRRPGMFQSADP